jgi:hypothetical protein
MSTNKQYISIKIVIDLFTFTTQQEKLFSGNLCIYNRKLHKKVWNIL